MKRTRVKMTKPLYLGKSVLDISKILMHKFQYDYISPKYGDKAKLCYTDTDSFIINIKTEDFFEHLSRTSSYDKNDKNDKKTSFNRQK